MITTFKYQRNRWFWIIKFYLNSLVFQVNRLFYKGKEHGRELKNSISIIEELGRLGFLSLLISFLTGALVIFIEHLSFSHLSLLNHEPLKEIIVTISNSQKYLIGHPQTFETLLSVVATITGTFIGLYFTAISVVISSVYAKVPHDVRDILLQEKGGNLYIRSLSSIAAISLMLLGYIMLGGRPGIICALFIVVLSCYSVLCFVILGVRAFYFFDPTELSNNVFYELNKSIRSATISGFGWKDVSFQAHYQKRASQAISTIDNLIKLCSAEQNLKALPLSTVLQNAVFFLRSYIRAKRRIPSDSRWYVLQPHHKNWFFSDSTALEIAIQTQTSIQPEMAPNLYWVEDEVVKMIIDGIRTLIQQNNIGNAYPVLLTTNSYLEELGTNLETKMGGKYLNDLGFLLMEHFSASSPDNTQAYKDYELALLDSYGLAVISLALGVFSFIRDIDISKFIQRIESINMLDEEDIYKKDVLPSVLPRAEFIKKRLVFEKRVEGELISPQWYVDQLIIIRYAESIGDSIEGIIVSIDKCFVVYARQLLDQKHLVLAASHSHRGLELCHKTRAHVQQLVELMNAFRSKVINKGLSFPEVDQEKIYSRIKSLHGSLVELIAKCLKGLSIVKLDDNVPDYFGQAYSTVCQECFDVLITKDAAAFLGLFPDLFAGSLSAHDKLMSDTKEMPQESKLAITFEPLKDIMELSGYALVFSELYDTPAIWAKCKEIWDNYLNSNPKAKEVLGYMIALYQLRRSAFAAAPRDYLRMNWQMRLNGKLREMNLIDDFLSTRLPFDTDNTVKHKSSLIRAICRGRYEPHESSAEIFILVYLLKRPESSGIDYKDYIGLSEDIEKESKG
ncbi:MAG: hypothetical protein WC500_04200 [Candidatus Margulisiibacteriota bacterium]